MAECCTKCLRVRSKIHTNNFNLENIIKYKFASRVNQLTIQNCLLQKTGALFSQNWRPVFRKVARTLFSKNWRPLFKKLAPCFQECGTNCIQLIV